jgi:prepilin-type N-terminal cleavage/methylation domain-containing protein
MFFVRQKMRAHHPKNQAFTLIEVLIVTGIIAILITIAVPNFVKARENARAKTCSQNLRAIESAKDQYLMENNLPRTTTVNPVSIVGPTSYMKTMPECPSQGTYTVGSGQTFATCSTGGTHVLQ